MRGRILALRLTVAVTVYYLSFLLFAETPIYAGIERRVALLLPGIEVRTVVLAILTAVVLLASILGGERSARFVYSLSIFFYLPTVLSLSMIDWSAVFGIPLRVVDPQPFFPTLLMGLAIIGGYMLFLSTSWLDETSTELAGRGGDRLEVNAAISRQFSISLVVIFASILLGFAAILPGLLLEIETLLASIPSAYAILGVCGGLLILAPVSFYIWAVRGPRPVVEPKPKGPESEITGAKLKKSVGTNLGTNS